MAACRGEPLAIFEFLMLLLLFLTLYRLLLLLLLLLTARTWPGHKQAPCEGDSPESPFQNVHVNLLADVPHAMRVSCLRMNKGAEGPCRAGLIIIINISGSNRNGGQGLVSRRRK